ncbi:diadenylate cyclase [Parabacteroides sp. PFB2-12]|uniref:diadenylate cyclase CdaA n=1 Tax=unclassified Parabacteroides TaxID=2649774 RepID=UPI00247571E0|nr:MULTISPECIES: diadenylate cyclase CdaA [unclassified Parabacteroides]MDH6344067.1 diadenylate cyclase [Parabacteroides sp. PM6-13]MDH6391824.1 diadenylate cyclase [Parabacteroides sp. PFB2-12]
MWIDFGIKDLIDVLMVAFFLYQIYKLMKNSGSLALFSGIVSFLVIWILISQVLEMKLMGSILDKFISVGFLVLVILFQDEIRRFLLAVGSHKGWKFISNLFSRKGDGEESKVKYVAPVVLACMNMARKKTGALIVIQQDVDLSVYIHTGEMFNADVNARLIENIFFKNSPLHDGAMIIADNRIKAAGCILPVAQNATLPKDMGLRHRSAFGMSLETDALIVIVSEERGKISVAQNGKIAVNVSAEDLQQILSGEKEVVNFS